jgi:Bacterial TniB protein
MHPGLAEPRTKEEWREYLDATPPPRPDLPDHEVFLAMTEDERAQLNRARRAYHSALVIVWTPQMITFRDQLQRRLEANEFAPAGARRGAVLDGPPTVGKSTLVKILAAAHEQHLRDTFPERYSQPEDAEGNWRDYTPVIYISVPAQATPKDLSIAIAEWLNLPLRRSATKTEITNAVLREMRICGTELVIIDDVHFLQLSTKEGKLVNDHLKYLANHTAATFLFTGHDLEGSGLYLEGAASQRATQTSGRNSHYTLDPFTTHSDADIKEWAAVIKALETALVLYHHQPGTLAAHHWRYLHQRTSGKIATLSALIREAAILAIQTGHEAITRELMDQVVLDRAATKAYDKIRQRQVSKTKGRDVAPATSQAVIS